MTKRLIWFSIPLILSGLLQQLYSWADAVILGNAEGELALAAVGATVSASEFLILLITGFSTGLSIMTAHIYGNGKKEEIRKTISIFSLLTGIAFLCISILCFLITPQLLQMLHTPAAILKDAERYVRIIFLGIPCVAIYNIYSAVLRGIGDSRIPFCAVASSALLNVGLDIVFVFCWHMGVTGAALATVISQLLLLLIIAGYASVKYPLLRLKWYSFRECRDVLQSGMKLGMPTAIQSSITACGNILLQKFMNGLGPEVVAAITVAYRIDSVIMLPIVNLGSAISTMTAQNMGAGQKQKARRSLETGTILMMAVTVILSFITWKVSGPLITLFHLEGEAADIGRMFFQVITRFYVVYGIAVAVKSHLEGKGDVIFSGIAGIVTLLARILFSYGLEKWYQSSVIAYAEGFSWILLLVLCLLRFCKVKNR